uniref:Uncharacterized protein n=1 Tax=Anguilla anguilla TaxID=7936 RepID=A0A0E9VRC8_ANGAN
MLLSCILELFVKPVTSLKGNQISIFL